MRIRAGAATHVGRVRQRNEDSQLVTPPLYAVADGMGGAPAGDVASAVAIRSLEGEDLPAGATDHDLSEAVRRANRAVYAAAAGDPALQGMGTTLVAALAEADRAVVAHVGDSRAYLLRDGALQQITRDHTYVQELVREGRMSQEQADRHPSRSVLTRVLGIEEEVEPDLISLDLHQGDRLLICTDGLTAMVSDPEIRRTLEGEPEPQKAVERLVEAAVEAGGVDNVTVIVLAAEEGEEPGSRPRPPGAAVAAGPPGTETAGVPVPPAAGTATTTGAAGPRVTTDGGDEPEPTPGRPWVRRSVWTAVVVVVLGAAAFGGRAYVRGQWYVGESNGLVAVYNGIPATVAGYHLSSVVETTDVPAQFAERLQPWQGLSDGITADSRPDAEAIVVQIRRDVTRAERPPASHTRKNGGSGSE